MRAGEGVGGRLAESAGERDGVEKADFGWRSRTMKDEEKTEAEEAGSGRQLSTGGHVQVRRRRANKARRGRQGKAERDVQGLCDDARLADRRNPGFQPASSLVVALRVPHQCQSQAVAASEDRWGQRYRQAIQQGVIAARH
ncbi:hypothetical protein MKX08_010076 [Trichoderma sp. CBMAI-0020]|nr:hypothetical protein MKX08_010076 [Trichoderma sp. CBMAI-0020]